MVEEFGDFPYFPYDRHHHNGGTVPLMLNIKTWVVRIIFSEFQRRPIVRNT